MYKGYFKEGVAEAILQQLGNNMFKVMVGVKQLMGGKEDNGDEYLAVKFKAKARESINYVKITLNAKDLYDIEFGSIRGNSYKIKKTFKDIYNDQLIEIFEETTGLRTSL